MISRGASAASIKAAVQAQVRMQPLNGSISDAEFNDLAAYIGKTLGITPTYIAVTTAPVVSLSASTLNFASQNVDSASSAQTLTVNSITNSNGAPIELGTASGSSFSLVAGSGGILLDRETDMNKAVTCPRLRGGNQCVKYSTMPGKKPASATPVKNRST